MRAVVLAVTLVAVLAAVPAFLAADAGSDHPADFHLSVPEGPLDPPPDRYDLREHYPVTPVWNQRDTSICYVLGMLGGLETSMVKAGFGTEHLSPYSVIQTLFDGYGDDRIGDEDEFRSLAEDVLKEGGLEKFVMSMLVEGYGPEFESDTPSMQDMIENGIELTYHYRPDPEFRVTEIKEISLSEQTDEVKWMLSQGIGCTIGYCSDSQYYADVDGTHTYNHPDPSADADHSAVIVGYDDNYPRENFLAEPSRDGAWLVKNSYGYDQSHDGYVWVSYETSIYDSVFFYTGLSKSDGHVYTVTEVPTYLELEMLVIDSMPPSIACVFVSEGDEELVSVMLSNVRTFYTPLDPIGVSVQIYTDLSDPTDPTSGRAMLDRPVDGAVAPGFVPIELPEPVPLDAGQSFSVCMTLYSPLTVQVVEKCHIHTESVADPVFVRGTSFFCEGGVWTDSCEWGDTYFPIMAFTEDRGDTGFPPVVVIAILAAVAVTALVPNRGERRPGNGSASVIRTVEERYGHPMIDAGRAVLDKRTLTTGWEVHTPRDSP